MSIGDFDRKTIIINSQFRESGDTNNFQWRFQERVENIRYAELRYFVLENGVYNVDAMNNTFYLSELNIGSTVNLQPVVIPTGYYDDSTFASTIGLCMSAASFAGGGTNLYFVEILSTGKLSISGSIHDFAIAFTTTNGVPLPTSEDTANLMGFTDFTTSPNAYIATSVASTYLTIIAPLPTILANFDYLLIQSQKLGNDLSFYSFKATGQNTAPAADQAVRGAPTACFAFVPNQTPATNSATLLFNNQRPPQISSLKYPYSLDYVDIALVDKFGIPFDTYGNNITLVIELYIDKKSQAVKTTRSVWDGAEDGCSCGR